MRKRFEEDRYYRPGDPELDVIASRGTLATWRWQGRGPRYTEYGNRVLYRGCDLNAWLDSRVVDPADRADEHARRRREFEESRERAAAGWVVFGNAHPAAGGASRAQEKPGGRAAGGSVPAAGRPRNPWRCCRSCRAPVPWWRGLCSTCAAWMRVYSGSRKAYRALDELARSES